MTSSRKLIAFTAVVGAVAPLMIACGASGSGSGELVAPVTPTSTVTTTGAPVPAGAKTGNDQNMGRVAFYWKSDGASWERGTMRATLPDGRVFEGQYLEPSTVSEVAASDWMGWYCGWYQCFGAPGPSEATVRRYAGYILARLDDGGQTRMNCRFQLDDPQTGPAHGGLGVCSLSTGEKVTGAELHK